jgi:hypothetical protein
MTNPLVAQRQDSTTAYSGIGIVESAVDLHSGISGGSWVEGGLGLVGGGLETLSLVIDPVGTLLSYGVAWLMEHVKPLSDALDWLAGDGDTIASYAQTWRNVSQALATARTDFDSSVRDDTAAWTGAAGDAYRTQAAGQSEQLGAASTSADTVGTVVEVVGVLVGVVREVVRDLIADCVATLIARIPQWLAMSATVVGAPVAVGQAVALISKWVGRISEVITKLVRSVNNLRPLLRRLDEVWEAIRGGLRGLTPGGPSAPRSPSTTPGGPSGPAPDPSAVDTPTVTPNGAGPTSAPTPSPTAPAATPTVSPDGPGTTTPASTAPSTVADTPTVRPDTTAPAAATTTPAPDPVAATPNPPGSSQPPAQTGGRTRPRDQFDFDGQQQWADDAYERFRQTDRDVDLISENTGIPREDVAAVKKHLMEDEHPLTNYDDPTGPPIMSRFDADPDIAEAWIRMADGRATPEDLALLRHETAELDYMRDHPGATYSEAHQHANTVSNWQDNIPPSTRENLDDLPWNRDGSGTPPTSSGPPTDGTPPTPRGDGPPQTGGRDGAGDPLSPNNTDPTTDPGATTDPAPNTTDTGTTDPDTTTDGTTTDGTDGGGDPADSTNGTDGTDGTDPDSPLTPEERQPQFDGNSLGQETFDEQYQRILDERGLDRAAHDELRMTPVDQLTDAQLREVIDVRNALTAEPGEVMTKALRPEDAEAYLSNATSFNGRDFDGSNVWGFTARGGDVMDVNTPQGLHDGLALDDGGAGWSPIPRDADSALQLRWQVQEGSNMVPAFGAPRGDALDGLAQQVQDLSGNSRIIREGEPFTGTGYTAGGLPEWQAQAVPLGDRAEIWRLDNAGNEVLVGVFDGTTWHRL